MRDQGGELPVIVIVVIAVLALVLVAASWSRVAASRLERRSVEGYGRALDTLGGVARRSESGAPVQAPAGPELARPHVRPSSDAEPHARPAPEPVAPVPQVRLRPPTGPGPMPVFSDLPPDVPEAPAERGGRPLAFEEDPTVVFPLARDGAPSRDGHGDPGAGDDDPLTMVLPAVPVEDPAGSGDPPMGPYLPGEEPPWTRSPSPLPSPLPSPSSPAPVAPALHPPAVVFDAMEADGGEEGGAQGPERSQRVRRAATGAAAAVALGALGAGGWQLAADSGSHNTRPTAAQTGTPGSTVHVASPSAHAATSSPGATSPGRATTPSSSDPAPTTTAPSGGVHSGVLQPTSTTSSLVVYRAPASHYTITFSVTGSSDCWLGAQGSPGGKYLWMQTVPPGGTASYTASGPVVIRLGAPPVVSVEVNGVKVALPPGNVQPYDISFTRSARAA